VTLLESFALGLALGHIVASVFIVWRSK